MVIKACIFDLDGVIVDTAKYHFIAWKNIASDLGFEFTETNNERLKGVSRMRSLDILLEIGGIILNDKVKQALAERKNTEYVEYINRMSPDEILPGARKFLEELHINGVMTALGSASKNSMTILNRLEITSLFDAIIDGNKVSKAKPDPEVFLKGAEELKVSASNCIVFEDAEAGVEAAIAAGMKCIGIGDPVILAKASAVIPGFKDFNFSQLQQLLR